MTMRYWIFGIALACACGGGTGKTEGSGSGDDTSAGTSSSTGAPPGSTSGGATGEGSGGGGQTEGSSGPGTSTSTSGPGTSGPQTTSTGAETSAGPGTSGSSSGTGGGLCGDFVPPGCVQSGCPDGQKCDTQVGCNPSSCSCDPNTGDIACTADCNGGTCVGGVDCGCQTDADCVKVTPGCCECNMGGKEVAFAKACLDQLEPCPLPPDQVACPAVYLCTDAKAVCSAGACALK